MPTLRSRTRQAGLLASLIALSLLALPLPTQAEPALMPESTLPAPIDGKHSTALLDIATALPLSRPVSVHP